MNSELLSILKIQIQIYKFKIYKQSYDVEFYEKHKIFYAKYSIL